MSRLFRAMALVLLAASCGGGSGTAPNQLDNACSIVRERPEYLRAFKAVERKYGVPVHVQMATIYQESKFVSDARPPYRYAAGVIPTAAFPAPSATAKPWTEPGKNTAPPQVNAWPAAIVSATQRTSWDGTWRKPMHGWVSPSTTPATSTSPTTKGARAIHAAATATKHG